MMLEKSPPLSPLQRYISLSKRLFQIRKIIDHRRRAVFVLRSLGNHGVMKKLNDFVDQDTVWREVVAHHPWLYEQITRQLFYRGSTIHERRVLIMDHCRIFGTYFSDETLRKIYIKEGLQLWSGEFQNSQVSLQLCFHPRNQKEGLASIGLKLGDRNLYQIIFWVAQDPAGIRSLWIGTLQGSSGRMQTYRDLTKHCYGYRPKNLVLFALRKIAHQIGSEQIYAISNYGHYANNHLRMDRKLQGSMNEFWQETGGQISSDPRFFMLPVVEPRKTIEQTKPHKHTLYRKRFAMLDEIDQVITAVLKANLKTKD